MKNSLTIIITLIFCLYLSTIKAISGENYLFCSEAGEVYGDKFKSYLNSNADTELVFENFEKEVKFPLVYLAVGLELERKSDCFSSLPEELKLKIFEKRHDLNRDMSVFNGFEGGVKAYFADFIASKYIDGLNYSYIFVVRSEGIPIEKFITIKSFVDEMD